MKIYQAYRYEFKPNNIQENELLKHTGCSRFAYNWGLEIKKKSYEETKKSPNAIELHRILNALKKTEFPWMYEVSKCAPQEALRDLDKAFKNFFEKRAIFPKFRKKGVDDHFRLTGNIKVFPKHIQIPRIGKLRTKEGTNKFNGKILSVTIKREADRWYISLQVEVEKETSPLNQKGIVGLDCNTKEIVSSDEERFVLPRPLEKLIKLLSKRAKQHSKKQKGSRNRVRSAMKLARLYRRIRNIRKDFYHKLSSEIAKTKQVICVESLKIENMVKNPYLSRSILDAGWRMFLEMLEYKTKWYGSQLTFCPSFYPSTLTCSKCGYKLEELPLSIRIFNCPNCELEIDRDLNAALNLRNIAVSTASSAGSKVCGDASYGGTGNWSTSNASLKQKESTFITDIRNK